MWVLNRSLKLDVASVKFRHSHAERFAYLVRVAFGVCVTIIVIGGVVKLLGLDERTQFGEQFLLTSEYTVATYLSAGQFILAGITGLALIRPVRMSHRAAFSILCLGLIFIGIDDALVIHERLGQELGRSVLQFFGVTIQGSYIRPWMVIYLPLLFVAVTLVVYLLPVFRNSRKASWAAGGGCALFCLGFVMEMLEPSLASSNITHAIQVGIEESCELMGAWAFMYAFVLMTASQEPGTQSHR